VKLGREPVVVVEAVERQVLVVEAHVVDRHEIFALERDDVTDWL
jgi:hypothetical protein